MVCVVCFVLSYSAIEEGGSGDGEGGLQLEDE